MIASAGYCTRLLTARRLRLYPALLLVAMLLAFAWSLVRARNWVEPGGRIVGHDYLAFYMAGALVADGQAAALYSIPAQQAWQQRFMAPINPQWSGTCLYLNPPHYAWAMSWLARLPYGLSLLTWWSLSLAAFAAAALIWRRWLEPQAWGVALLVAAASPAWMQALAGGQNSFLSLLILTGFCALLLNQRELAAGLVLALLGWKFQLMIVPAALLLWQRRIRGLLGLAVGSALTLGWTAAVMGPDALTSYARFAAGLGQLLETPGFDVYKQHSWHGFFALLGRGWLSPTVVRVLTAAASLATFALLLRIWRAGRGPGSARLVLSATLVATLLISPHLFHYDVVIAALPAVLWRSSGTRGAQAAWRTQILPILVAGFAWLGVAPVLAEALRVQLTPWLLTAWLVVALRTLRAYAGAHDDPADVEAAAQIADRDGAHARPAGHAV